jgi:hypothetical protein
MTTVTQLATFKLRRSILERCSMNRFFFDVATTTSVRYDYQGRIFGNVEEARALAELIALDLSCSEESNEMGEVQVRNVSGSCLFSIAVRAAELEAA